MKLTLSKNERKTLRELLVTWENNNRLVNAMLVSFSAMLVMLFMIAFDAVFIPGEFPYLGMRIFFSSLLAVNCLLLRKAINSSSLIKRDGILAKTMLMLGSSCHFFMYVHLLFNMKQYNYFVYFSGSLLIILVGTFVLHRFWREQYVFTLFCVSASLTEIILNKNNKDPANIMIVASLVGCIIAVYFRREFASSLYEKYNLMRSLVPPQIAFHITSSSSMIDEKLPFEPDTRRIACLTADWRGFQKLCNTKSAIEVSKLLEVFYDTAFEYLANTCPDGKYFASWTADELFITFYSETDDEKSIVTNAMRFAVTMATDVYDKISSLETYKINFDIGISTGFAVFGLQGPKSLKSTTTIGEVPGIAKRFEQEAKRIRTYLGIQCSPIIIADHELVDFAQKNNILIPNIRNFSTIHAKTKDVEDRKCSLWCRTFDEVSKAEQEKLISYDQAG